MDGPTRCRIEEGSYFGIREVLKGQNNYMTHGTWFRVTKRLSFTVFQTKQLFYLIR